MEYLYPDDYVNVSYNRRVLGDDSHTAFELTISEYISNVAIWVIISISLPLNGAAIHATRSQVPKGNTARVYVLNLLVSDLIQLCSMMALIMNNPLLFVVLPVYFFGLMVSVGFMVCVALERFLVSCCAPGSCARKTIQICEVVCMVVWATPLCILTRVSDVLGPDLDTVIAIFFLLPGPVLVFLLVGTVKAQCAASGVAPGERRRTVASVVLLVLVYSLLFLPNIIFILRGFLLYDYVTLYVLKVTLRLSPLADVLLYFCLPKRAKEEPAAARCCRGTEISSRKSSTVNDDSAHAESSV